MVFRFLYVIFLSFRDKLTKHYQMSRAEISALAETIREFKKLHPDDFSTNEYFQHLVREMHRLRAVEQEERKSTEIGEGGVRITHAGRLHGARNNNRGQIFRKWLQAQFPPEAFRHVLDVAGGKGELAVPLLLWRHTGTTTIVDPRVVDLHKTNKILKNIAYHLANKQSKTYARLVGDGEGLPPAYLTEVERCVAQGFALPPIPLPPQLAEWFTVEGTSDTAELAAAKATATLVIGLHADQATEPIVAFSMQRGIPFAVVPCCVFPNESPHRRVPCFVRDPEIVMRANFDVVDGVEFYTSPEHGVGGTPACRAQCKCTCGTPGPPVRTYEQFLCYLVCTYHRGPGSLFLAKLAFEGRNLVVFARNSQ